MNRYYFVFGAICLWLTVPSSASAQFEGMKYRIPADANTMIAINAEKLFGSPVADRGRWEAKQKAAFDAGLTALPVDATEVLMAARMDQELGRTVWELSLVKLRDDRSVNSVAQRFGGTIDQIEGRFAAHLPADYYVIQMMSNLLASYTPANRQDVSRWLRSSDVGVGSKLSSYLTQAFDYAAEVGTPIVMAIDIEGSVSATRLRNGFDQFECLKELESSKDQIVDLLSGAKGVTLGITLQDSSVGAIRVDFSESPEILADVGKELLMDVLQRQGAMIDDLEDWTPSVRGNTFYLRGTFSEAGMRRIMSVVELPRALADAMLEATSPGANTEEAAQRIASQQYFKSVNLLIEDLREKPKRDRVQTFGQAAMWYDKYARKLDHLPILNVDEGLLEYGAEVSSLLRQAEMAMKGVGMRSSVRTAENNPSAGPVYTTYGGYRSSMGYYGGGYAVDGFTAGRAQLQEKGRTDAVIRTQERAGGAASVQQIWQLIDESTAAMRRALVAKYSAEF